MSMPCMDDYRSAPLSVPGLAVSAPAAESSMAANAVWRQWGPGELAEDPVQETCLKARRLPRLMMGTDPCNGCIASCGMSGLTIIGATGGVARRSRPPIRTRRGLADSWLVAVCACSRIGRDTRGHVRGCIRFVAERCDPAGCALVGYFVDSMGAFHNEEGQGCSDLSQRAVSDSPPVINRLRGCRLRRIADAIHIINPVNVHLFCCRVNGPDRRP